MRRLVCAAAAALFLLPLIPPVAGGDTAPRSFETFSSSSAFFDAWKTKKWKGVVETQFTSDASGPFLHLKAVASSWAFLKSLDHEDLAKTPVLSWRWRVSALPPGGDGRRRETDDEAAQVYVFFPGKGLFPKLDPRIVGYTWETVPPPGTFYHSPKNDSTRVTVLRSGADPLDTWCAERRNVRADFRAAFGEEAPRPLCVCLQIDADDTASRAESAFRDLRLEAGP